VAVRIDARAGQQRQGTKRLQLLPQGYGWILPSLVVVLGVLYFSIGYTGYMSTLDWDGSSPLRESVGWSNYSKMLGSAVFWRSLRNTAVFFVFVFGIQTFIGLLLAAIVHSRIHLAILYKVFIFIPVVLAPAFMAPVFRKILDANGPLNSLLERIGLGSLTHAWLAESATALPAIILITVWGGTGLSFILFFAALGQIEPEMLEAARIDGANPRQVMWWMIIPSVRGTIVALAILTAIGSLKIFDWPYLVTNAGPNHATEFLGTYIFRTSIPEGHVGYGAALSIVLLVVAVVVALILNRARSRDEV